MSERVLIPADPDQRRLLWREWIHADEPHGKPAVRRIGRRESLSAKGDWLPEAIDAPAGIIHGLKAAIAECLVGGTLPITDRERLIERSMKLGLNRFEANLLIAAVQNRHRESPAAFAEDMPSARAPFPIGGLLIIVLLVEFVAGLALFRLMF